jgi:hypothetical protein
MAKYHMRLKLHTQPFVFLQSNSFFLSFSFLNHNNDFNLRYELAIVDALPRVLVYITTAIDFAN